jgi:hypothetical protein
MAHHDRPGRARLFQVIVCVLNSTVGNGIPGRSAAAPHEHGLGEFVFIHFGPTLLSGTKFYISRRLTGRRPASLGLGLGTPVEESGASRKKKAHVPPLFTGTTSRANSQTPSHCSRRLTPNSRAGTGSPGRSLRLLEHITPCSIEEVEMATGVRIRTDSCVRSEITQLNS